MKKDPLKTKRRIREEAAAAEAAAKPVAKVESKKVPKKGSKEY